MIALKGIKLRGIAFIGHKFAPGIPIKTPVRYSLYFIQYSKSIEITNN
jgi:hypothetical protein